MKNLYTVVSRDNLTYMTDPTFQRELARSQLQSIKARGVDAIIIASKLDREQSKRVR